MHFVHLPGLPGGSARLCALAAGQDYIADALAKRGVQALPVGPAPGLAGALACHADLQLFHLGEREILQAGENRALTAGLERRGFTVIPCPEPLSARYPGDVPLCCFPLGERLFCNPRHTSRALLARYPKVQAVRQGYARCSACVVDSRSIITADSGIAGAAVRQGCHVLRIRPGHIRLPGYEYGFIGGCSGHIGKNLLAFTGDITTHPDWRGILSFCADRGVEAVSLTDGPLVDVGGILPLLEE